jgi:hypothetical protein
MELVSIPELDSPQGQVAVCHEFPTWRSIETTNGSVPAMRNIGRSLHEDICQKLMRTDPCNCRDGPVKLGLAKFALAGLAMPSPN